MSNNNKKRALGKGLDALLNSTQNAVEIAEIKKDIAKGVSTVSLNEIEANPYQPRTEFEQEALQELAESIKVLGIIQPITLRHISDGKYQIISGERRFRASKLAGLTEVPAYIRTADDQAMLEMALVENIQRENLNSIEVALSYQRLMDECSLTQELLSERVAKKRSTVANYLRLLRLPAQVQAAIKENRLSMGQARAIISIDNEQKQIEIFNRILAEGLSVRQIEDLVRDEQLTSATKTSSKSSNKTASNSFDAYSTQLSNILSLPVKIQGKEGKGKVQIVFKSENELQKLIQLLEK